MEQEQHVNEELQSELEDAQIPVIEEASLTPEEIKRRVEKLDMYIKKVEGREKKRQQEWDREMTLSEKEEDLLKQGMDYFNLEQSGKVM